MERYCKREEISEGKEVFSDRVVMVALHTCINELKATELCTDHGI